MSENTNAFEDHIYAARSIVDLMATVSNAESEHAMQKGTLCRACITVLDHLDAAVEAHEAPSKETQS